MAISTSESRRPQWILDNGHPKKVIDVVRNKKIDNLKAVVYEPDMLSKKEDLGISC